MFFFHPTIPTGRQSASGSRRSVETVGTTQAGVNGAATALQAGLRVQRTEDRIPFEHGHVCHECLVRERIARDQVCKRLRIGSGHDQQRDSAGVVLNGPEAISEPFARRS